MGNRDITLKIDQGLKGPNEGDAIIIDCYISNRGSEEVKIEFISMLITNEHGKTASIQKLAVTMNTHDRRECIDEILNEPIIVPANEDKFLIKVSSSGPEISIMKKVFLSKKDHLKICVPFDDTMLEDEIEFQL